MEKKEILAKLLSSEIKFHEIEKFLSPTDSVEVRQQYLKEKYDISLDFAARINFDPDKVYMTNCENVVGSASLPLGIAGPAKVNGQSAKGEFFVPLATTEGTLVASVNRGLKIIKESGGAITSVKYNGITRAPVFKAESLTEALEFEKFVNENVEKFKEIIESTDPFIKFIKLTTHLNGRYIWIRINFNTQDAMGMNMAVKATKALADYLVEATNIKLIAISGNMCIDKKPATINSMLGRGRDVTAEVFIPKEVCLKYLKSDPKDIEEVNFVKTWIGSAEAGSLGFNAHVANIIAAVFIATGQDPAHVVDASVAKFYCRAENEGLYCVLKIPTLNIATFGGGTKLQTQSEAINIILKNLIDSTKIEKRTDALAEIICVAALAGEISLHAAFSNNTFAQSHEKFGRKSNQI